MEREGVEVHIETNEARGGSTPHIVRYVLLISLLLAIIAMSVIWMTGAASSSGSGSGQAAGTQANP